MVDLNESIWWLIKSNSLKEVWRIFAESFHCFHIHIKMWWSIDSYGDQMSLSDGLSSQTHWRRFVTHLCKIFSLFWHSYQDVVIDRLLWRIKWVYLMTYQAKLIEEGSWRIFVEPFRYIHIRIKMWWSIDSHGGSNEFIWWLIKPNSLKKVCDASLQNFFIVFIFISKCGNQMKIKEDSTRKINLWTKPPRNLYPALWSLAYLHNENPEDTLHSSNASDG